MPNGAQHPPETGREHAGVVVVGDHSGLRSDPTAAESDGKSSQIGQGVPPRIADGGRGDQKIEFVVETPVNLSKDQRNQLETLRRIDEDEEVYPQRAAFANKLKEAAEKAAKEP